jgi:thermitase
MQPRWLMIQGSEEHHSRGDTMKTHMIIVAATLLASGLVPGGAMEPEPRARGLDGWGGQFIAAPPQQGVEARAWTTKQVLEGEVLVAFRRGVSASEEAAARGAVGAMEIDHIPQIGVKVWRLPPGLAVAEAVVSLSKLPAVRFTEPNWIYTTTFVNDVGNPLDPSFSNPDGWPFGYQEHLRHDDAVSREIHAEEAWSAGAMGAEVVVAVIDTGVDLDHPDLDGNLFRTAANQVIGGNFLSQSLLGASGQAKPSNPGNKTPSSSGSPQDDHGHGTHVAGIIAAEINNVSDNLIATSGALASWAGGVVGVAPMARIMPVKVLDATGRGGVDGIAKGILFAADNGAQIINLSLGGSFSQTVDDALNYAWNRDVVIMASAGNTYEEWAQFPASNPYTVSVGAVDSSDRVAIFSNRGAHVDLMAPGVAVLSSFIDGTGMYNGGYGRMSGTSMSSPMAAGVAALIRGAYPGMTAEQVIAQLLASADAGIEQDNPGCAGQLGAGRVDAFEAVGTQIAPRVMAVRGLERMMPYFGSNESIWVRFTHAMDRTTVLSPASYTLLNVTTDTAIPLSIGSDYRPFPGEGVRLAVQQELPMGAYRLVVGAIPSASGVVSAACTIDFAIEPVPIFGFREVPPLGSLIHRATATSQFRSDLSHGLANEVEPNGTRAAANALPAWYRKGTSQYKTVLVGEIHPNADIDYYILPLLAGDEGVITMEAVDPGSGFDAFMELRDAKDAVVVQNHIWTGHGLDAACPFRVETSGNYYIYCSSYMQSSSGAYRLSVYLKRGTPPSPLTTELPETSSRSFAFDVDQGQTVTFSIRSTWLMSGGSDPVTARVWHSPDGDITPTGLGFADPLTFIVGPLEEGRIVLDVTPLDPFTTMPLAVDCTLNALTEHEHANLPQSIDSSAVLLNESGAVRLAVTGRLNHFTVPRIYAEAPGKTNDLRGSWDQIGANEWAINGSGNPQSSSNQGVVGSLDTVKNVIQNDHWWLDVHEGDRLDIRLSGAKSANQSLLLYFDGQGSGYGRAEFRDFWVPYTGRARIQVSGNKTGAGPYELTVVLRSRFDPRPDLNDSYTFTSNAAHIEAVGDPCIQLNLTEHPAGSGEWLVRVKPAELGGQPLVGPIDYAFAVMLDSTLHQLPPSAGPLAQEWPEDASAALGYLHGGLVAYYTDEVNNLQRSGLDNPITVAGVTPLQIPDIAHFDFSQVQVLILNVLGYPSPRSPALDSRLAELDQWVHDGGVLIIHDGYVSSAEGKAETNPLLVGAPGVRVLRTQWYSLGLAVVADSEATLFSHGPGGSLAPIAADDLPFEGYCPGTELAKVHGKPLLATLDDPQRIVAFTYKHGAGTVYYSCVMLDRAFRYDYIMPPPSATVYAPNLIAYCQSLALPNSAHYWAVPEGTYTVSAPAGGPGEFVNESEPRLQAVETFLQVDSPNRKRGEYLINR